MRRAIIHSHIREGDYRRSLAISLGIHLLMLLLFAFGVNFWPQSEALQLGSQGGGMPADTIAVGLTADLGGGDRSMYKPAVTPRANPVPPPPDPVEPEEVAPSQPPAPNDFVEEVKKKKPEPKAEPAAPPRPQPEKKPEPEAPTAGQIPSEGEAGQGGASGGDSGAGGILGGGQGVKIGSGRGQGEIDSWYVRQVEQRVGQNWLKTSLGRIPSRVEAIMSFEIRADGRIQNIEFEKQSGVPAVDLAARRAILASNPLPPLPWEFRNRTVRFRAVFEYPPP